MSEPDHGIAAAERRIADPQDHVARQEAAAAELEGAGQLDAAASVRRAAARLRGEMECAFRQLDKARRTLSPPPPPDPA